MIRFGPLHDAHNHLQDPRLASAFADLETIGLATVVVNGSSEDDWDDVQKLAAAHQELVLPSFGLHPWYVADRSPAWLEKLTRYLDAAGDRVGVGEIGLDKWIRDHDIADQHEVFVAQLRLAAERNLPVSIHCLKAWGTLTSALEDEPVPARGFLLHGFGGPAEMVDRLLARGAYFSFNPYFMHERKHAVREVFSALPPDRIVVETDAPDMLPPEEFIAYPLPSDNEGKPPNHPGNIVRAYEALASICSTPVEALAREVDVNFKRLFG